MSTVAAICPPAPSLISPPSNPRNSSLSFPHENLTASRFRLSTLSASASASKSYSDPAFVFHELGLPDPQLRHLLQDHPHLNSTPPQSLRASIAKLRSLNITDLALARTISRRPDLLASPEIDSFLDFVLEETPGIDPEKLERILLSSHPQFFTAFPSRIRLLLQHGVPKENLGHIVNNVNVRKVFVEMPMRDLEEALVFLQRFRWPDVILRRPSLLNLDFRTQLVPRVEFFTNLADGDEAAAASLISKLPAILAYTVEHFESHQEFWRSVGLMRGQLFKIALVYPNVFSVSRERKLKPRVEFLRECGLDAEDVFKFLIKAPIFLSLSFEKNLSKKLSFLVKIGYRHRTRELAAAVGAATRTSSENMQMVIGMFLGYGFSYEDLLIMSTKHPQILQYNCESLEKKVEFLVEDMERDVGELMAFPAFLGYKLDDRIKHRYEAKKDSRGKGMSLNKLLSVSTKRFNSKK